MHNLYPDLSLSNLRLHLESAMCKNPFFNNENKQFSYNVVDNYFRNPVLNKSALKGMKSLKIESLHSRS